MKLVYIAGKYRSSSVSGIYLNIANARNASEKVFERCKNTYAVTPHMNTAFMDGLAPDQVFLDGTLELMTRCDAVLMLPEWEESAGAITEHDTAMNMNIPVFYSVDELAAWTGGIK